MPPDFPEARLRRAGLGAARIAALQTAYAGWGWAEQAEFRRIVGSRADEVIRRVYDPTGVSDAVSAVQVAADPTVLTAVQAAILAAHDTDAERETFVPARLAGPALSGSFAPYRATPFTPPLAQPVVVSTMESGWTKLDNGTLAFDAAVFDAGTASLRLTTDGVAGSKIQGRLLFTAQDWSGSSFSLRIRTDDWAGLVDGYILLSTSGTLAQFFRCQITPRLQRVVNGEWVEITLTRGDFDFNSGTASWTTVNGVQIQLYGSAGKQTSVWFDHLLRYPTPAKATVSFAFDDGFATTVTSGKPALDKYGYRGTVFLMPTAVNTAGYLTQAQVDLLAQAGWDIGGHNVTDLTTLTFAQAEADVAATKAYLVDHGYKGGDAYAYPLGGHTFALRAMVAKYFNAARATSIFGQTRGYMARRNMMGRQLGPAIAVATAQAWITQAVGANEWLIITAHAIRTPTSTAEDYTPTNFAAVVDAVAASGAQVLPVSEALAVVG